MKILSLDGGGVFGVGQALGLSQIDNTQWDAVCGTSVGSVLAGFIGTEKKISVDFFRNYMPEIFKSRWYTNPIFGCRHTDRGLNRILGNFFAGEMFKDVSIPTYITASSIDQHCSKVFCSSGIEDGSWLLSDVIRCSCAAQTYFKPWMGYGDGGIFANNPSMIAVTRAMMEFGVGIDDIELCSIGTGTFSRGEYKRGDNLLYWSQWMTSSLFEGGSDKMFDEMASALPLKKYERYQFLKQNTWKIDSIPDMQKAITAWTKPALDFSKHIKQSFFTEEDGTVLSLDEQEQETVNNTMETA